MSDFFDRAVDHLGATETLQPRVPWRFEPVRTAQPGAPDVSTVPPESATAEAVLPTNQRRRSLLPADRNQQLRPAGPPVTAPADQRAEPTTPASRSGWVPPPRPAGGLGQRGNKLAEDRSPPSPRSRRADARPDEARALDDGRQAEPPATRAATQRRVGAQRDMPVAAEEPAPITPASDETERAGAARARATVPAHPSPAPAAETHATPALLPRIPEPGAPLIQPAIVRETVGSRRDLGFKLRAEQRSAGDQLRGTRDAVLMPMPPRSRRRSLDELQPRRSIRTRPAAPDATNVEITIGRIELRSGTPAPAKPAPNPRNSAPGLGDYLRHRSGSAPR